MQVLPVINNKGGVGKTTTAVNVAAGLARRGRRVLLVDLDSQGSASVHLGVSSDNLEPSVARAIMDGTDIRDITRSTFVDNLDLVTGSLELANADIRLKGTRNRETRLRQALDPVLDTYDQIVIDCAPSTSVLTINALTAGDGFIIPVTPSYLALEGVVSLGKVVRRVRQNMGEAAPVLGILLTATPPPEDQSDSNRAVEEELRNHYGAKVFKTRIRRDDKLEDAPARGEDIFAFAPDSTGASDYSHVLDEIEDRIKRYGAVYSEMLRSRVEASGDSADGPSGDSAGGQQPTVTFSGRPANGDRQSGRDANRNVQTGTVETGRPHNGSNAAAGDRSSKNGSSNAEANGQSRAHSLANGQDDGRRNGERSARASA
jgi:chromosome partitioning protein